eukprot:183232-Chlamydomonas_euryale.AAC.1
MASGPCHRAVCDTAGASPHPAAAVQPSALRPRTPDPGPPTLDTAAAQPIPAAGAQPPAPGR